MLHTGAPSTADIWSVITELESSEGRLPSLVSSALCNEAGVPKASVLSSRKVITRPLSIGKMLAVPYLLAAIFLAFIFLITVLAENYPDATPMVGLPSSPYGKKR